MEDIKVKLARIDEKFEMLCEDESNDHDWHEMQEGLLLARQITVAEHLEEMEAAGMPCPSLEEVVEWIGVYLPPEVKELAKTLDNMSDEQANIILGVVEQAVNIAETEGEAAAIAFLNDLHAEVEQVAEDVIITPEKLNALLREAAEADADGTAADPAMYEGLVKADNPAEYMDAAGGIPVHDYGNSRNVYRVEVGNAETINKEVLDKLVSSFDANAVKRQYVDEELKFGDKVKPAAVADDLIAYVQKNFPGAEITRKYGTLGSFGIDNGSLTIKINY